MRYPRVFSRMKMLAVALATVAGVGIPLGAATSADASSAASSPPAGWVQQPGAANAISVGASGAVWVVGTNATTGGYGIWHWNGTGWVQAGGGAVTIAVDPNGLPWVVNSAHQIYHWAGTGWVREPGAANAISVGANGAVWVVGTNATAGGYGIWHWNGTGWVPLGGGAVTIAVDPNGRPWVVNSAHQIYDWAGSGWVREPGAANAISVGASGAVWVVGTNATTGGYGIWHWNGTGWVQAGGGAVTIAVDPNGLPWVVNSAHQIYHWAGTGWVREPGAANAISVGASGAVWVVGTNATAGGYGIWHWNGTGWAPVGGGAVSIAVDASGDPYIVDSAHRILTIGTTAVNSFSSTPGSLTSAGGNVSLSWSTANAVSCTISVAPAVAGLPVTVPCSNDGASVMLPANSSTSSAAYTFTLTAAGPAGTSTSSTAATTVAGAGASTPPTSPPVSTSTSESPNQPAALNTGQGLTVTFDQAVTVAPNFSLTLTDGTNEGTVDNSNATVSYSNGDKTVTFTLTADVGLAGANLEVLAQSGVSGAAGPWNLLTSGEVNFNTNASPSTCTPVNSRVFGGTNCLNFGAATFGGPDPTTVYDVIARPTYDLPGPSATTVNRNGTSYTCATGGCDAAPEVITNCSAGSTDSVYDLTTGALLGAEPCGTWGDATVAGATWPGSGNEGLIGNTTGATLDYISTPNLQDNEQVAVVETVPSSLWVSGTAVPPQIVSASASGASSVTFTFDTPVTCPTPGTLSATDAAFEAAQFFWYTDSAGIYTNNHATSITCPPAAGGTAITATFAGDAPPSGTPVDFKFEGFGIPLIPTGGTSSPFAGEREASQSFEATLG